MNYSDFQDAGETARKEAVTAERNAILNLLEEHLNGCFMCKDDTIKHLIGSIGERASLDNDLDNGYKKLAADKEYLETARQMQINRRQMEDLLDMSTLNGIRHERARIVNILKGEIKAYKKLGYSNLATPIKGLLLLIEGQTK